LVSLNAVYSVYIQFDLMVSMVNESTIVSSQPIDIYLSLYKLWVRGNLRRKFIKSW
jgi:hypothetical protein